MLLLALLLLELVLCANSFLLQPAPRPGFRCSSGNTQDHELSHADATVAVVGSGVGGLATAARLAKAGAKVIVVEKNSAADVGGRVNEKLLGANQEYRFDTGPSLLLLPAAIREAFADLGYNSDDFFEMRRVSPAYKVRLTNLTLQHDDITMCT
jgi:phytoene dehydrogenase-like protein